jgi:hypothetical protein
LKRVFIVLIILIVAVFSVAYSSSYAQNTITRPGLGTAASFAVLGGRTVTNTGASVLNGNLGVSPGSALTGFPPGIVHGAKHKGDAVALQAQKDVKTAYNVAAGAPCNHDMTGVNLGGKSLKSGVYCFSSSAQLTGLLALDGAGVYIFQIGSKLTTASNASVSLVHGASPCNVFWQIGSSATIGTNTAFVGNILALTSIAAQTGATFNGSLYARNGEVTLDDNTINRASCITTPPKTTPTATGTKFPHMPNTGSDPTLHTTTSQNGGIMHTLLNLVQPHAVTMFVLALICLLGYGYPGYRGRATGGFIWLLWLIGGIMAIVAWVILIFA